jgi:hypothetical protein
LSKTLNDADGAFAVSLVICKSERRARAGGDDLLGRALIRVAYPLIGVTIALPPPRLASVLDNYSMLKRWTRVGPRACKPAAFLDLRTAAFAQAISTWG